MQDLTAMRNGQQTQHLSIHISIDTPKPGHLAFDKGATKLTLPFFPASCVQDKIKKERHS
jgi:hypothetical protein